MYSDKSISFIIPIYNCASYVEDCLKSIICQDKLKKEIILVNDGSTDNTQSICTIYSEKYDFIHLINQENAGTSSARNRGLEIATGDYIWFVDSDDMIVDGIIPMIMPYLSENIEVACFNHTEKTANGYIERPIFHSIERYSGLSFLGKAASGYLWNKIFRRDIIGNTRFLEGTKNIEDFLFCIQVLKDVQTISCLPYIGYIYNCTNTASTLRNRDWKNLIKLSKDSIRVHFKLNDIIQSCSLTSRPILLNLLNISIAGHLHSLLIDYNRNILSDAVEEYKKNGLYPIHKTTNKKANIFITVANIKWLLMIVAYLYDLKRKNVTQSYI